MLPRSDRSFLVYIRSYQERGVCSSDRYITSPCQSLHVPSWIVFVPVAKRPLVSMESGDHVTQPRAEKNKTLS